MMNFEEFRNQYTPTLLEPEKELERLLAQWARWRNSNDYYKLGFPRQVVTESTGSKGKKSGSRPLPAWVEEMMIECVVEKDLKQSEQSYYNVIQAAYNISTISNPRPYSNMTMKERAANLGMSRDMFYAKLNLAKSWLRGRIGI